jgi:uncharacterized protein YbbK (DUF523 family)
VNKVNDRPRVGASSCLLGEHVRYDGATKAVPWIRDELPKRVEVVSICPEVGAGMSVPRPPIAVVKSGGQTRLHIVGAPHSEADVTAQMTGFINVQLQALVKEPLHGFILKARSPSCGVHDTPYLASATQDAEVISTGSGLWAEALRRQFPNLPLVDESHLANEEGQHSFLQEVLAYQLRRETK